MEIRICFCARLVALERGEKRSVYVVVRSLTYPKIDGGEKEGGGGGGGRGIRPNSEGPPLPLPPFPSSFVLLYTSVANGNPNSTGYMLTQYTACNVACVLQ